MSRLLIRGFSFSFDGYSAGPDQDLDNPLGVGGMPLIKWEFATQSARKQHGLEGGATGLDDDMAARGFEGIGAWIIGRNMFGPIRGPWLDGNWKGWWGDDPVFRGPAFVLTHYARDPIVMLGGTTFHFVTDGIHAALERGTEAANGQDIRLAGGVSTIKQYLKAGLVDDMHFVISPVLIGSGERLFDDLNLPSLGYELKDHSSSPNATHMTIGKIS